MAAMPNRVGVGGSILLLDRKPYFTASGNDTTATAKSKDGNTMAVSFWVADPPQLSIFSIHCTYPDGEPCPFSIWPRVVGADGPFVLLRGVFDSPYCRREYFLYKAAAPSSLERIPGPDDRDDLVDVKELGILTQDNNYLLAALRDAPSSESSDGYQLRIYSSETKSWTTRTLPNPCPGIDRVMPDKVIRLGGTQLGWVDLSHGILVCDLPLLLQHQQDGAAAAAGFFIPLPEPLPGNMYKLKYPIPPTHKVRKSPLADPPYRSASWFRDLTCVNGGGVLKFVEMENPPPENNEDNVIYGSDLLMSLKRKAIDGNPKQQLSCFRDAWRAVTWTLKLVSSSPTDLVWHKTSEARVAEIKEKEGTQPLTDLYSAFPILSPDDDASILHLKSVLEPSQRGGMVVAVDIGNKSLKAIEPYCLPDAFVYHRPEHPFRACTLSRHLDMTNPGIQVSAYRKITEASNSANHPGETSIRCDRSYEPLPSISETMSNIRRRLKEAGVYRPENDLPPQQCFNKWDYAPGYPSRALQNNVPQQQYFHKPDGPSGPGYALLAPLHGRHNYQPLWPPSNHQLPPSSEFGPHEAPQPCFNSYHGYSQPPNLFAYGAHTCYDNYRHQQLPPTLELPIGASWQHPTPPVVQGQPNIVSNEI
uniref:Uncharacterized protein n=1 Tax=Avena sativa TaxID=4498 RepID=A0ACD5UED6_AVESA